MDSFRNQEIIDACMADHLQRISFIPKEKIVRTYPKLHRVENSNKVMLEMCTEYWP